MSAIAASAATSDVTLLARGCEAGLGNLEHETPALATRNHVPRDGEQGRAVGALQSPSRCSRGPCEAALVQRRIGVRAVGGVIAATVSGSLNGA